MSTLLSWTILLVLLTVFSFAVYSGLKTPKLSNFARTIRVFGGGICLLAILALIFMQALDTYYGVSD